MYVLVKSWVRNCKHAYVCSIDATALTLTLNTHIKVDAIVKYFSESICEWTHESWVCPLTVTVIWLQITENIQPFSTISAVPQTKVWGTAEHVSFNVFT